MLKSFKFAFRGFWFCIKNERNMRIHLVSSVLVSIFAYAYGLDSTRYAVLIITMGTVISSEVLNTSIEALVDLGADSYNSIAKIVKDVAAGAVLVSSITAVGVGFALFFNISKLSETLTKIFTDSIYIIVFLVVVVFGALFIFRGIKPIEHKESIKIYSPRPTITNIDKTSIDEAAETKIYTGKSGDSKLQK